MKPLFALISLLVLGCGLYLALFYDVPDDQETINFFVSRFLIIIGLSSLLINFFWSTPTNKHAQE